MKIVLDTNIIYRSGGRRLLGTETELIAKSKSILDIIILVPELVIEESINIYADDYHELFKCITELSHLVVNESEKPSIPNMEKALDDYRNALNKRINELDILTVKHDNITHRPILDRIFNRRKPFAESRKHRPDSSKGYRDSLLWETICHNVAGKEHKTIFITDNWKNFAESKSQQSELHPHLKDDLWNLGLPEDAVVLCPSLEEFNRQYIKPQLETLEDIKKNIEDNTCSYFNLASFFEENFDDIFEQVQHSIRDEEDEISSVLGIDLSEIYLYGMYEPNETRVTEVRKLSDAEVLVSVGMETEADIEFFVFNPCVDLDEDGSRITIAHFDWEEGMGEASTCIYLDLEFDIILDHKRKETVGFNVVAMTTR